MKLKIVLALLLLFSLCHTAGAVRVDWYQLAPSGYKKVDFVVPFVKYKAVVKIYSNEDRMVDVLIKNDVPFWFDEVIAKKRVELHKGLNVIEIPFVLKSWRSRGVFVVVSGIIDVSSVSDRIKEGLEIHITGYYFQGLLLHIGDKEYYPDDFAPIPSNSNVLVTGNLIGPDGKPVPDFEIKVSTVTNQVYKTRTTESGTFTVFIKTPDWREYGLCNKKVIFCKVFAIDNQGRIVTFWDFKGICVCISKPKAKFVIEDIRFIPQHPVAKKPVLIIAFVKNIGSTTATGKVTILVDNYQLTSKEITLRPNEVGNVTKEYIFLYNKTYTITVVTDYDMKSKLLFVGTGSGINYPEYPENPTPTPTITQPIYEPIESPVKSIQKVVSNNPEVVCYMLIAVIILLFAFWRCVR